MGKKSHTVKLNKYARKTGAVLKYEIVCKDGKQVTVQVVINGEVFPCASGANAAKAKANAAKSALRCLKDKENQRPGTANTAKKPALPVKHEKKDQQRYENICSRNIPEAPPLPAGSDGGAAAVLPELTISADSRADEPNSGGETSDSSSPPCVQDISEEMDPGNSFSEMSLTPKTLRSKSEFLVLDHLGSGGFGCVHKVLQKLVGKCYALKITPCKQPRKALREVRALSDLDHSNIIRYHACWMEKSGCESEHKDDSCSTPFDKPSKESPMQNLYILMELCDKKTLTDWIEEENDKGTLRPSERREKSLKCILQIVEGVVYIHSKMFIHRDLKPGNILFGTDGRVKIGDFGLVTTHYDDDDKNPMIRSPQRGTPRYMAPEQTENTYDRKVDIFPLGLVYFELLWKVKTLFEKSLMWNDIRKLKLPEDFKQQFTKEYLIIRQMLNLKPGKRPEATEVKTHLDQFAVILNARKLERQSSRTF
ncbi:interferon-induced, double-stranded RNA-activated protein kinase-like isoform X2 [Parambassis ranga]|uniref:non-specific serine/threonine protein kinase n=1 Tax=Parambassis ranga TaxID=210632 RepID=A0A6P7JQ38_9TELE|nr:interferon-induced, double-stranded RNA-activated protein kinase-like isoform X2 [Parambassis ranga]